MTRFEVEVGQVVAGRYRLERLLGRGAMGEVWTATHMTLGEQVAIKFLRPEAGAGEDPNKTLARFLFEAQVAARLSRKSRHIVRVTDHGDESGVPYLVMEKLEGESLEERMQRGLLPMPTLQEIVTQCARGLAVAHAEGVFHRDLKPANVFLCRDEDGGMVVKLLDFGIARAVRTEKRSPTSTARGVVLGTPSYMSPEQARGLAHLDHRCDVWALAVVAYEALTQRIPFPGETAEDVFVSVCTLDIVPIGERRADLGPDVRAFFDHALAEKLGDRFQSAAELASAFAFMPSSAEESAAPFSLARAHRTDDVATQGKLAVSMAATPHGRGRVALGIVVGLLAAFVVAAFVVKSAVSSRKGAADGLQRPSAGRADVAVQAPTTPSSSSSAATPPTPPASAAPVASPPPTPVAAPSIVADRPPPSRPVASATRPPASAAAAPPIAPAPAVTPDPPPAASKNPPPTPTTRKPSNPSEVF